MTHGDMKVVALKPASILQSHPTLGTSYCGFLKMFYYSIKLGSQILGNKPDGSTKHQRNNHLTLFSIFSKGKGNTSSKPLPIIFVSLQLPLNKPRRLHGPLYWQSQSQIQTNLLQKIGDKEVSKICKIHAHMNYMSI